MPKDPAAFAAFDAAISALASSYAHRAGPDDFREGEQPRTLLPRAGWAARVALDLALVRSLLTPVMQEGGPRASPTEIPVYGSFAYALAQGLRHAGWAAKQKVTLDAVVGQVLTHHGCALGLDQDQLLPVLGRSRYRALRRRALERPVLRQMLHAASQGFATWVLEPSAENCRWLSALYRYFCAHLRVTPMLGAELPVEQPARAPHESRQRVLPGARLALPAGEPRVPSP